MNIELQLYGSTCTNINFRDKTSIPNFKLDQQEVQTYVGNLNTA